MNMDGEFVDLESCPYYKELQVVYPFTQDVKPMATCSSLVDCEYVDDQEWHKDDMEGLQSSDYRRKRSHAARPRSDATEPFATVKRIHQDLGRLEKDRTQLIMDMHSDHVEMFNKFITVLKNR